MNGSTFHNFRLLFKLGSNNRISKMGDRILPFIPDFQKYAPMIDRTFDQIEKDNDLSLIRRAAARSTSYQGATAESE